MSMLMQALEEAWESCQLARYEKEVIEAQWRDDKAHAQAEREFTEMDLAQIEEKLVFLDEYVAWQTKVLDMMRRRKFNEAWIDLRSELEDLWINYRTEELLKEWK